MEALKLRYKKKLLRKLLIEDDRGISVIEFLKGVDMKQVSYFVAEAWDEIDSEKIMAKDIASLRNPKADSRHNSCSFSSI